MDNYCQRSARSVYDCLDRLSSLGLGEVRFGSASGSGLRRTRGEPESNFRSALGRFWSERPPESDAARIQPGNLSVGFEPDLV